MGDLCSNTFSQSYEGLCHKGVSLPICTRIPCTTSVGAYNDLSKFLKANCDFLSSDIARK